MRRFKPYYSVTLTPHSTDGWGWEVWHHYGVGVVRQVRAGSAGSEGIARNEADAVIRAEKIDREADRIAAAGAITYTVPA